LPIFLVAFAIYAQKSSVVFNGEAAEATKEFFRIAQTFKA
jgi:hypothetical protein